VVDAISIGANGVENLGEKSKILAGIQDLKAPAQDEVLKFLKTEAAKKQARQKQKDKLEARQRGLVDALAKHANKKAKVDIDCWERDSFMSLVRDPNFKRAIVEYYGRGAPNGKLMCQVLNRDYPSADVIASHIWKSETRGEGLEHFGLQKTDIHNNRNGLLLCKGIEEAFDRKQVCFIYDFLHNKLMFFVADQTLLDRYVFPSKTVKFSDVDGLPLMCGPDSMPYRRLLSWHAYLTLEKYGWAEKFQSYGQLSQGAPDLEALLSRIKVGAAASDDEGDATEDAEGKTESEGTA